MLILIVPLVPKLSNPGFLKMIINQRERICQNVGVCYDRVASPQSDMTVSSVLQPVIGKEGTAGQFLTGGLQ